MTRKGVLLVMNVRPLGFRIERDQGRGGRKRKGGLTLLVCNGADLFDQAVQRGHELGVAADTGEVGGCAARGGNAGFRCG